VTVSLKRSLFRRHGEATTSETFRSSTPDARGMVARHDGGHFSVHDHAYHCEYATKGASAQTHSHRGSMPCLIDQSSFSLTSDPTTAYHCHSQWLLHLLRASTLRLVSLLDCDWHDYFVDSSQYRRVAQEQAVPKHYREPYLHRHHHSRSRLLGAGDLLKLCLF
jgi:hypothetical protein